jgi:branched-subunit amino acid transport protein AzlD
MFRPAKVVFAQKDKEVIAKQSKLLPVSIFKLLGILALQSEWISGPSPLTVPSRRMRHA